MLGIEYAGPVALVVGAFVIAAIIALVEWGASSLRRRRKRRTWWRAESHNPTHYRK